MVHFVYKPEVLAFSVVKSSFQAVDANPATEPTNVHPAAPITVPTTGTTNVHPAAPVAAPAAPPPKAPAAIFIKDLEFLTSIS